MEISSDSSEITVQDLLDEENNEPIKISMNDIEKLNVILNNNDCGDLFFQTVCEILANDGFPYRVIHGPLEGDIHNSTIVTLDMLYSGGSSTMIFAPIDNTRADYSDSLALSMRAGFQENDITHQKIVSGRVGFRKEEDGTILHSVPTPTEEAVGNDLSTSYVTISFGTEKVDPVKVAKGIESGLLRHKYYIDHYDAGSDLIYKSKTGEEVSVVANYFGSSIKELSQMNELKTMDPLEDRAIINPVVRNIDAFNPHNTYQIEKDYFKAY